MDSMKRLLDPDRFRDSRGRMARPFDGDISLLAFCLMDNHFHLVLRQHESRTVMSDFMKRLTTSYALNQKTRHGRTGPLFDRCYQAVRIESDQQLKRTIAYVHANLATPLDDRWSSHSFYMTNHRGGESRWLDTRAGLAVYGSRGAYLEWFMRAVEARRARR
ncbi:MAG: transposase [Thermoleophilaceae bacterium]|nr:transposase [Thermoleophilaceae bacterium]